jgi:hypothetical protein
MHHVLQTARALSIDGHVALLVLALGGVSIALLHCAEALCQIRARRRTGRAISEIFGKSTRSPNVGARAQASKRKLGKDSP